MEASHIHAEETIFGQSKSAYFSPFLGRETKTVPLRALV
jgi:hypothetical protein